MHPGLQPLPDVADWSALQSAAQRVWSNPTPPRTATLPIAQPIDGPLLPAAAKPDQHLARALVCVDALARLQQLRGLHPLMLGGWQSHSLLAETLVRRQHELHNSYAIERFGVERFRQLSQRAALAYRGDVERLANQLGCLWVNDSRQQSNDPIYQAALWWAAERLWSQTNLRRDAASFYHCPQCQLALDESELIRLPAPAQSGLTGGAWLRLPLVDDPAASLVAWVDPLWAIPFSPAVLIDASQTFTIVELDLPPSPAGTPGGVERLILAESLLETVLEPGTYRRFESFPGKSLAGVRYRPLFTVFDPSLPLARVIVIGAGDASPDSPPGARLICPGFHNQDYNIALAQRLPVLQPVAPNGQIAFEGGVWRKKDFLQAGVDILDDLEMRGLVLHKAPPLDELLACAACHAPVIELVQKHWLVAWEAAPRLPAAERLAARPSMTGVPFPAWACDACDEHLIAVDLMPELREGRLDEAALKAHQPPCPNCSGGMHWAGYHFSATLECGLATSARWGAPWEGASQFARAFPAWLAWGQTPPATPGDDLVTRRALAGLLWEKSLAHHETLIGPPPFAAPEIADSLDQPGLPLDAVRWSLLSGQAAVEVHQNLLKPLWEALGSFTAQAQVEAWQPGPAAQVPLLLRPAALTDEERSLLLAVYRATGECERALDAFDWPGYCLVIQKLIPGSLLPLCQSGQAGLAVRYEAWMVLMRLLTPGAPYLAETLYQMLVAPFDPTAPRSVQETGWPAWQHSLTGLTGGSFMP